jgi:hypothetical protein
VSKKAISATKMDEFFSSIWGGPESFGLSLISASN